MLESIRSRRILITVSVLVSAVGVGACGDSPESAVHNVGDLAQLAYAEDIRIGSVDDPDIGFSRIRRVRVSETGEVYVLEASANEVRVFNSEGRRLRVIGGSGEGPGEFSLPLDMGLLGDTLWVADAGTQRLTWFGPDGRVLFTMPTHGVPFEIGVRGVQGSITPRRPRPDGLIESDLLLFVSLDREIRPYRYPVLLFDREGAVVDTLRWETADEGAVTYRLGGGQGYAPGLRPGRPLEAALPNGRVVVDWAVAEGTIAGAMDIVKIEREDSIYNLRLGYEAISVPGHVLDSLIAPRLSTPTISGASQGDMESALREAIQLPDFRPPVRVLHAGDDGTVWLQLNTPVTDGLADWVVIARDGLPRGGLRLPSRMQIHYSALPMVWVVEMDEVDVPWLVRLRVE